MCCFIEIILKMFSNYKSKFNLDIEVQKTLKKIKN